MARIRSIKPEFWTSEQVVECSRDARLLFVGMWNFCDDSGVHPASIKRIKMEVFPGDFDVDEASIRRMIDELLSNGLLQEYSIENNDFWLVTGWYHQKIDKPNFKFPLPDGEIPTTTRRPFDDRSPPEGKGREGKGRERTGKEGSGDTPPSPPSGGWVLPGGVDVLAWGEFEKHRKAIRKPLTDQARDKNAAILQAYPQEVQRQIVDTTIANRWTGLFPPKGPQPANATTAMPSSRREL